MNPALNGSTVLQRFECGIHGQNTQWNNVRFLPGTATYVISPHFNCVATLEIPFCSCVSPTLNWGWGYSTSNVRIQSKYALDLIFLSPTQDCHMYITLVMCVCLQLCSFWSSGSGVNSNCSTTGICWDTKMPR